MAGWRCATIDFISMRTAKSEKPLGDWLEDKIDEWGLREAVEEEVGRLMLQQKIAERRKRLGISQSELAKRTGVSQPMIAKFESGPFQNITLPPFVPPPPTPSRATRFICS